MRKPSTQRKQLQPARNSQFSKYPKPRLILIPEKACFISVHQCGSVAPFVFSQLSPTTLNAERKPAANEASARKRPQMCTTTAHSLNRLFARQINPTLYTWENSPDLLINLLNRFVVNTLTYKTSPETPHFSFRPFFPFPPISSPA